MGFFFYKYIFEGYMKEIILNHPLITHKLSILRAKATGTKEFREIISEIVFLLCFESTKDERLYKTVVENPLEKFETYKINEDDYAFVPILKAGMSMVDGILNVISNAKIGHIVLYRNETTLEPVEYYYKMSNNINRRTVLILDSILATGGSALATISRLKKDGVTKIKFLCVIASSTGIKAIQDKYPDVEIYCASKDGELNDI